MRSSPQITSTVSGKISSSRRMSLTRRLPVTATSRRGFRRMTFTGVPRLAPRKSGRALDLADLRELDSIVLGLEDPPLGEVQFTQAEMLERERARIERRELLYRLSAPLARGLHRGDQLADRLAVLRPDDRRRLCRPRRRRGQGSERGEIDGKRRQRARGLGLTRKLRGQLARGDLGDGQMVHDLAD